MNIIYFGLFQLIAAKIGQEVEDKIYKKKIIGRGNKFQL